MNQWDYLPDGPNDQSLLTKWQISLTRLVGGASMSIDKGKDTTHLVGMVYRNSNPFCLKMSMLFITMSSLTAVSSSGSGL